MEQNHDLLCNSCNYARICWQPRENSLEQPLLLRILMDDVMTILTHVASTGKCQ